MAREQGDIIIGIDAGTSVIKAVAFGLDGQQLATASVPNHYTVEANGAATQSLAGTWADCVQTLRNLGAKVAGLAARTAAIAVTGQGDGTWLVGKHKAPVGDAWLWLDARSAATVKRLRATRGDAARFAATGTGLAACSQGAQLAFMAEAAPELLAASEVALHCKDWLYLNLTGVRATDPSEASFTFGNFRTRDYDDEAIEGLGLGAWRRLLPPIVDGARTLHPLTAAAAAATGLMAGTPVCLGFVDIVSTALGAGIYTDGTPSACSVVGSTGMHMRATPVAGVHLNEERTGYVIPLPVPGLVAQVQSNLAATLNLDWLLGLAADLVEEFGETVPPAERVARIDGWLAASRPAELLFHPYISEAGERGPFVDAAARAGFIGLTGQHRFADLLRAVVEGLGMAMRDCYAAMGAPPPEVRLSGGATRSPALRAVLAAAIGADIRTSRREEAGAAGAAMMAAVAIGAYPDMESCIAAWVAPLLDAAEAPEREAVEVYARLFPIYREARLALVPVWQALARQGAINRRIGK